MDPHRASDLEPGRNHNEAIGIVPARRGGAISALFNLRLFAGERMSVYERRGAPCSEDIHVLVWTNNEPISNNVPPPLPP